MGPIARAADFSYVLTTRTDPAQPGKVAQFTLTVTNLTAQAQYAGLSFHVPRFTTYSGYPEGTLFPKSPGYVAAGASKSVNVDLTVLGG
jgi:hypothetical protein